MNNPIRILIADDDHEDRFIMNETFNDLGYSNILEFVEDGVHLMEYLADNKAADINLIILDHNMPRLTGTETLRALKKHPHYKHIPVILFSTSINEIEKDICLTLGAIDYKIKPADYEIYLATCKEFYRLAIMNKESAELAK